MTKRSITQNRPLIPENEANSLLAAIIQSSDDAIISEDLNGIIQSWNRGAEDIFDYSTQEAIGHSMEIIWPKEKLMEEKSILETIVSGAHVEHFQTMRKCKDGRLLDVSVTVSPIYDKNGKLIGASHIIRNFTKQKKLEYDLARVLEVNRRLAYEHEAKIKYEEELLLANKKLQNSLFDTVELARQLGEMRDLYTAGHEKSVGNLAEAIATELGLGTSELEGIRVAGYLHDIGKIIVPIEILVKPSRLTLKEYELVKEHVEAGYKVLKDISFPWPVARVILEHHERLDGSGYPHGLKADEISMGGRIIAVADVVDAMTAHRPYRAGLGLDLALAEIQRGSGILYDKVVVDACINLIKNKSYQINETLH